MGIDKHYRVEWEKEEMFKGWLCKAPEDLILTGQGQAYCKWCRVTLRAQKHDLKVHCSRKVHESRAKAFTSKTKKKLTETGIAAKVETRTKITDIKLVLHIAAHSSTKSIDHLSELLKKVGKGSDLEKLRLHRTKASKIILNVISPGMLTELIEDIGEEDYSIIVDESTDVSIVKYMAYCVRYFSKKLSRIVTNFLGFNEVGEASAIKLHKHFREFILSVGLKLEKLISIGTDGASNLCGKNHSLHTLLKKECPKLQLIKCSCHSLNSCAAKACEKLPSTLEFLLRETRNWFTHSPLRQMQYNEIYSKVNIGNPPKLIQLSNTRWLAWYEAVKSNLNQWNELKKFFGLAAASTKEKSYTARTLAEMYNDNTNLLYLLFLEDVLFEVTRVNLAFQHANADVTKLYSDLKILLMSVSKRIFAPVFLRPIETPEIEKAMLHTADINAVKTALSSAGAQFGNSLLSLDLVDFGGRFKSHASENTASSTDLETVKQRCLDFLLVLCEQLVLRLPENLAAMSNLRYFTPAMCLSQTLNISADDLPWEFTAEGVDKDLIRIQWRQLRTVRIHDISIELDENVDITKFWIAVWNLRDASGNQSFKELASFAIRALSLPISNADVERVFSVMSVVKTKLRNRILLPMLVALIRIRIHMSVFGFCCKNYEPSKHTLKLFISKIYEDSMTSGETDDGGFIESINLIETVEDDN